MAMRILLTTLNAKFIHSSLALWYLYSYCRDLPVEFLVEEFDINQELHRIYGDILRQEPHITAFSCYIWNIEPTLKLVRMLKQVRPGLIVLLGGPEVSYDPAGLMAGHPAVDYIISGEGEVTFREFLQHRLKQSLEDRPGTEGPGTIPGLAYRRRLHKLQDPAGSAEIVVNPPRPLIEDLDSIPSPFGLFDSPTHLFERFKDKIVYYESSRGCPFGCRYCLSSLSRGVRYFSMERVKSDLRTLIAAGVKQVKFVDRTFNSHRSRALEIFRFLAENTFSDIAGNAGAGNTEAASGGARPNFHFEIAGDLLDDEILDFLVQTPPGLFQFEIGVQSTNPVTLDLIDRKTDLGRLKAGVFRLKAAGNIHLHLDLIAGLPGEDYASFQRSFDEVFELRPGRLQLGFLKLLKGSSLRERASDFGCVYTEHPPYEVLATDLLSHKELLRLKLVEDLLEKYYNSHRFEHALEFLIGNFFPSPFRFFEAFSVYWEERKFHQLAHRLPTLYRRLYDFAGARPAISENLPLLRELLRLDYLLQERYAEPPEWLNERKSSLDPEQELKKKKSEVLHRLAHDQKLLARYFPDLVNLPGKEIARRIRVESFAFDLLPGGRLVAASAPPRPSMLLVRYDLPGQPGNGAGKRVKRFDNLDGGPSP